MIGQGSGDQCGELVIDGLLVQGSLTVTKPAAADDGLGRVELRSCTLVPASGGLSVQEGNDRIAVALSRTICGPVALADDGVDVDVFESIIDSGAGAVAVAAPGTTLTAAGLTALGSVDVRYLEASDSIFDDTVTVARRQWGCVRFSYVTPGSATPRRYRCQPQLAEAAEPADPNVAARLEPAYVSDQLTNPGYARLAERAGDRIAHRRRVRRRDGRLPFGHDAATVHQPGPRPGRVPAVRARRGRPVRPTHRSNERVRDQR